MEGWFEKDRTSMIALFFPQTGFGLKDETALGGLRDIGGAEADMKVVLTDEENPLVKPAWRMRGALDHCGAAK